MAGSLIAAVAAGVALLAVLLGWRRVAGVARRGADANVTALRLPIGSARIGPYRIVSILSRCPLAITYRARAADGGTVAVKLPSRGCLDDEDELKRFAREAHLLDTVHHPNIVRKIADGQVRDAGRKVPYIVLEDLPGIGFDEYLAARAPLLVADATRIMLALASALEILHAHGIVHRNLSPSALRITDRGDVMLYSFGFARSKNMNTITSHGQVVGTVEYMAPEQMTEGTIDVRADLYAFGVLGFWLLTGKSPFVHANMSELLKSKRELEGPHVRKLNAQVPVELDRLLSQLMNAEPKRRLASAAEVGAQLRRIR